MEREDKILREEVALLRQARFGRSSERMDPGQLALFLGPPDQSPSQPAQGRGPRAHPRPAGHGRSPFAAHLSRNTIVCDVPEAERVCACGKALQPMGEDVSERGHIVPARIVVNRYLRKKYACRPRRGDRGCA